MTKVCWANTLIRTLCAILLAISQLSCGGNGGNASAERPGSAVNGALRGTLFLGGEGEGWRLDMADGTYTRIPGLDWDAERGAYPALADISAYPQAYRDDVFLAKIENCQRSTTQSSRYDDCLVGYTGDGTPLPSPNARIFQDIVGTPKLSRDGQYLAFFYDAWGSSSPAELSLVVTDLELSVISAAAVVVSGAYTVSSPSLTWLPDNRLAYTFDQHIYLTDTALSTDASVLAAFDANEGEPRQLTASPDGHQLAFVLVTDSSFRTATATPWVMNTEGNRQGLRQLARVQAPIRPSFRFPCWSPDGRYVLLTHGRVAASDAIDLGLQGGAYVIPAESDRLVLADDDPAIQRLHTYFGMTAGHEHPSLTTDFDIDAGPIAWLPNG